MSINSKTLSSKNLVEVSTMFSGALLVSSLLACLSLSSSFVSADDSIVDDVDITVPVSCTLSSTGNNSHTATINNGTYNDNIGITTLKSYCNDLNGFAIYAIGYTDDIDGKNVLTDSGLGSTYDISTGTSTSGNSQWAMKLATVTSPAPVYPISIENSFNSFHTVPNDYTLVAKRTAATDVGSAAVGSTLTATYQVYISQNQPAGTYIGQVKYVLVHPNDVNANWILNYDANGGFNAPSPTRGFAVGQTYSFTITDDTPSMSGYIFAGWSENSASTTPDYVSGDTFTTTSTTATLYAIWIENKEISVVFNGNSADAGSMTPPNSDVWEYVYSGGYVMYGDDLMLIPSNYSRSGYGFAGWSTTQLDPTSNNFAADFATLASNNGIYGPNQMIHIDASFMQKADLDDQVTLYAVWVPVVKNSSNVELTFQTANLFNTTLLDGTTLSSKPTNYVTALRDVRDNDVYAIAKLADGSWWMMENLRLNPITASITSSNTNNPTATFLSTIAGNQPDPWSGCSSCTQGECSICFDSVNFDNSNLDRSINSSPEGLPDIYTNYIQTSWYSYGTYYNYYTATAGNGTYDTSHWYSDDDLDVEIFPSVSGDICPSGWKLPLVRNTTNPIYNYPALPGSAISLVEMLDIDVNNELYFDYYGPGVFADFPYNFIPNGYVPSYSPSDGYGYRLWEGGIWTATSGVADTGPYGSPDVITIVSPFWDGPTGTYRTYLTTGRSSGYAVRCVATP